MSPWTQRGAAAIFPGPPVLWTISGLQLLNGPFRDSTSLFPKVGVSRSFSGEMAAQAGRIQTSLPRAPVPHGAAPKAGERAQCVGAGQLFMLEPQSRLPLLRPARQGFESTYLPFPA